MDQLWLDEQKLKRADERRIETDQARAKKRIEEVEKERELERLRLEEEQKKSKSKSKKKKKGKKVRQNFLGMSLWNFVRVLTTQVRWTYFIVFICRFNRSHKINCNKISYRKNDKFAN